MLNPLLIRKLREGLVKIHEKDLELDTLSQKHIQFKDLMALNRPQNITNFQSS